jgi:hypothetical protein
MMESIVVSDSHEFQVLGPIVQFVTIDMVDVLAGGQVPA